MHDVQLEQLKETLTDVTSLALTTDFWSDRKNNSFMCLTGHWIDNDINFQSSIIDFQSYNDRHVAVKIGAEIKTRLHHLNIENKISSITTDGGSNVRSAVENVCKINRIWCVAHRLHLVICNGLLLWKKSKKNKTDHDVDKDDLDQEISIRSNGRNKFRVSTIEIPDEAGGKSCNFIHGLV